jgi:hypothetical protein
MEQKQKRPSFFSNMFAEVRPSAESTPKKVGHTSNKYNKNFDELVLPTQKTETSYSKILENAISLISTFTDNIPREIKQQICQQSILQQSDGNIDQVLVEATKRKSQLMQEIKQSSDTSEASVAEINAEIDRLWNLRDQLQEDSKQKQWHLTQSNEQLDQLISLLVDSNTPTSPTPMQDMPKEKEPELIVVAAQAAVSPPNNESVSLASRNPRRLSTLMTATN